MALTKVTYSMIAGSPANAIDFGAYTDGTNASATTTAIQAALDSGASSVYIPAGTYALNGNLTVPSNIEIYGDGNGTVLQTAADNVTTFTTGTSTAKSGIIIRDLLIDGGGQTTNIYTGYKAARGIYITNAKDVRIENVTVQNMGIINQAAPQTDLAYSGMGITAEARFGDIGNIRINNCTVKNVAGGGMDGGDGIYIAGYASGSGTSYVDTVVSNCWVSTCGRHCYTVAGGSGETTPSGVKFVNCYGEKSSLDWLDIEEGYDVTVDNATIYYCGNDQTYYNPVAVFGSTYRLLAGIATGNACNNILISNTLLQGCYYGITYGSTNGLTISNTKIRDSVASDLYMGLASSPSNLKLVNVNCATSGLSEGFFYYNPSSASGFYATGCIFTSKVKVSAMQEGIFDGCFFNGGFQITGGSAGFSRNKFIGCQFNTSTGIAFDASIPNGSHARNTIDSCHFRSTGSPTIGVAFGYNSAFDWKIMNNTFSQLLDSGIKHTNCAGAHAFDATNNSFISCVNGINVAQALNNAVIANNYFSDIAGTCISIAGVVSGYDMIPGPNIIGNMAGATCINGLSITLSSGTYDYTIITGNNMHNCSGTKWNLAAGNANGQVANNITT